uniref:Uncharacterized protein n=1 Tax=Panagrolaimus sp. ES5 TaxID=591445 RepID=A0AC34GY08_9BILA
MKRTYVRRSDLYSTPSLQRPIIQSITSPTINKHDQPSSASSTSTSFIRTNSTSNNDSDMAQKLAALEALVNKVVGENEALQATVESLKAELIPEGCTLATFSISSTPRYGYITIPNNLFEELADKLVRLTQGHEDHDLKHAILLRINFGLNDKIQRTRKHLRNGGHTPEAVS